MMHQVYSTVNHKGHMTPRLFVCAVIALMIFAGCSAASRLQSSLGTKYKYSYRLTNATFGQLSYRDQRIKIQFRLDDGAIRFKLQNLSPVPIKIRWDESAIGVRNRYYAVRNKRTLYTASHKENTTLTIPPSGYVIDMAIPSENIMWTKTGWKERDLLQTTDRNSEQYRNRILGYKGSIVEFAIPLEAGGEVWPYKFRFQVTSVDPVPWEKVRRPYRPAPPAPPPGSNPVAEGNDYVVAAVIAAGVLGVAAILLTQRKEPIVE
ncbi:MAG: hypothetical protein HBSIN02_16080 [Bacteroidia bacterium]|nr:MAG: hypothetical protein HBSIN02_16080 [Bacteroidia bacterium]